MSCRVIAQMSTLLSEQYQVETQLAIAMSMLRAVGMLVGCTYERNYKTHFKLAITHEGMRRCVE
jgi:hypothetical protein